MKFKHIQRVLAADDSKKALNHIKNIEKFMIKVNEELMKLMDIKDMIPSAKKAMPAQKKFQDAMNKVRKASDSL